MSLVSKPEVELELGGPYQELVQDVLDEVEPEADPVPCAQGNVEDCLVGVVRWNLALTRLGQCTAFVVDQLKSGQTVYLHCGDGVGRTGVVSAAVVGILAKLPAEEALARAEDSYVKRRFIGITRCSPETEEQRTMVRALLDKDQAASEGGGAAAVSAKAAPAPEAEAAAAAAAKAADANPWRSNYHDRKSRERSVPKQERKAPALAMTPRCDFEFVAAPAPEPQPDSKPVTPSAEPSSGGIAEDRQFIGAPTFDGPKAGFVFQRGDSGVGYYPDTASATAPKPPAAALAANKPLTQTEELRKMQAKFAATAVGVSDEDAAELERLRLARLEQMKRDQKVKEAELERRFDAYMADKAKTDQDDVSSYRQKHGVGGFVKGALPAWAQGLAARDALAGASAGPQGQPGGETMMRPSEQRAADAGVQPAQWGDGGRADEGNVRMDGD